MRVINKYTYILLISVFIFLNQSFQAEKTIYITRDGEITFLSNAPLEVIRAKSKKLVGVLNIKDRSFTFSLPVNSFEGFNSSIQQTHFNEDYLESEQIPNSTFKGKIIEEEDLSKPGTYRIRAKGKLNIHGIENDRIIRCDLKVTPGRIDVQANFTVFLSEHNIKIPSIVNQKISEEIQVGIKFTLTPSNN